METKEQTVRRYCEALLSRCDYLKKTDELGERGSGLAAAALNVIAILDAGPVASDAPEILVDHPEYGRMAIALKPPRCAERSGRPAHQPVARTCQWCQSGFTTSDPWQGECGACR